MKSRYESCPLLAQRIETAVNMATAVVDCIMRYDIVREKRTCERDDEHDVENDYA